MWRSSFGLVDWLFASPHSLILVRVFAQFAYRQSKETKMRTLQTFIVRVSNNTLMDPDTFKLIRKLCAEFELPADIEFTCYEAYVKYFNRYFAHLEKCFQKLSIGFNGGLGGGVGEQTSQMIDQTLDEVENTSLVHTLALISVCAKYVNGYRCEKLITRFSKYLQLNGTPFSVRDIRTHEYTVFKFLDFNVRERQW